jgi:L,D-transpeptidase catalytic domain
MQYVAFILVLLLSPLTRVSALDRTYPKQGSFASVGANNLPQGNSTTEFYSDKIEEPSSLEDSLQHIYHVIGLDKYDLSYEVFKYGMIGYYSLRQQGKLSDKELLTIIDFTKSSTKKRFYTIDLDKKQVKYHTYVSHGRNTGEDVAKSFSNTVHSNQSSLGFYITGETYVGSKGYSLKLDGMEKGYNDKLRERAVVMHPAEYVSEYWIKKYGRLGRSQGCPALPPAISKEVIETIKGHTAIFAYYNDEAYLNASPFLDRDILETPGNISAKLTK